MTGESRTRPRLVPEATRDLMKRVRAIRTGPDTTIFEARRELVRLLGALYDPDTNLTSFGFWAPDLAKSRIADKDVFLELFTPIENIDFTDPRQALPFQRSRVHLERDGDYWWGVLEDVAAGSSEMAGAFYWLRATDPTGHEVVVHDLVAHSIPFGTFAPAEVYDVTSLQRGRRDLDYFATDVSPPTSMLEVHIPTATAGGTIADLTDTYEWIGRKLRAGVELTPAEQVYGGYDAIQPLPIDPTIERPEPVPTFSVVEVIDEMAGLVGVLLRHPDNKNWGYDNIVASSSATNPSLLRTRRPDEVVALTEALHGLPQPMLLLFDVVYGHADNQALEVLPARFFKGPNMYGQDLNHQDPTVRAILLEMQRRRINTGADGLRVDGAQDFKFYDPRTGEVGYDDDFLQSMSDVVQEIGPHRRRLWMIFEDGRPWPDEGWETTSTYRHVIDQQPDTYQWGPFIFAHNTPMIEGFWSEKWWRVAEMAARGGHWISGVANHDTVRRGTQVDPSRPLNKHLGDDLPTILDNAYDNDAVLVASYGLLPGIPMDFLNATTRTPWAFMRTTDDVYGVKVMSEEAGFLDWQLTDEEYREEEAMWRVKRHGFASRRRLRAFLADLADLIEETDYDLDSIAGAIEGPKAMRPGREGLTLLAYDYMSDVHDLCNVAISLNLLDPERVRFAVALRGLRRKHVWLREDCRPGDSVEILDGDQTIYRGHRVAPDGSALVASIANMAGASVTMPLAEALTVSRESETAKAFVSARASVEAGLLEMPDGSGLVYVWEV